MQLAVVHYHLNRGGVTQVVLNHLRALDCAAADEGPIRVALIYGGRHEGLDVGVFDQLPYVDVSLHAVDGLDYDSGTQPQAERLAERIGRELKSIGFVPQACLLHVHNHSLGKNVSLPGALHLLARQGYRLLLQIHDFAEDFRPDNYRRLATALVPDRPNDLPDVLYPQAPQIHYAVLNGRDLTLLKQAGIKADHLHLLPNPVQPFGKLPDKADARRKLADRFRIPPDACYLLYPVRGIRRKNLGEALLWSILSGPPVIVGLTLPPLNPLEQPSYCRWKELAKQLRLRCVFETGAADGLEFKENLSAADLILTTSVAEGFGLVFLECWLAGRRLVGRDLPEITADFVAAGLRLQGLAPQLRVPLAWVGRQSVEQTLLELLARAQRAYGRPPSDRTILQQQLDRLFELDSVDFAVLSSKDQQRVLETACRDEARRRQLLELNPWVSQALQGGTWEQDLIAANAQAVQAGYSLQVSGRRLAAVYQRVLDSPTGDDLTGPARGEAILDMLLDLPRLHPVRLEQ